jgi:hypothetical protein
MFYDAPTNGEFAWGVLNVFDSFEAARADTPSQVIATAMRNDGVVVEELDI